MSVWQGVRERSVRTRKKYMDLEESCKRKKKYRRKEKYIDVSGSTGGKEVRKMEV